MLLNCEGIVLKTYPYDESDLMVICFTDKLGKISAYAKNARKMKSKIMQVCQPFAYSKITLDVNGNMYKIHSAELIDNYYSISLDIDSYTNGCELLNLAINYLEENQANIRTFKLMNKVLNSLKRKENIEFAMLIFKVKFLYFLGLKPNIDKCLICNNNLTDTSYYVFSEGRTVCGKCIKNLSENQYFRRYNKTTFILFDYITLNDYETCMKAKVARIILQELNNLIELLYKYNFSK